nr:glucan endo-1,3-beta-glucosidase 7 [Quercus suber]
MVDVVVSAMVVVAYENISIVMVETGIVMVETGWLSFDADASKVEANSAYVEMYLKNLVVHLRLGISTLLRKEGVAEVYIYELFDKKVKQRNDQNWGFCIRI